MWLSDWHGSQKAVATHCRGLSWCELSASFCVLIPTVAEVSFCQIYARIASACLPSDTALRIETNTCFFAIRQCGLIFPRKE